MTLNHSSGNEESAVGGERALLEAAAKAAGIELRWEPPLAWVKTGRTLCIWNPLQNDGDALQLAVRLNIDIQPGENGASADRWSERLNDNGQPRFNAIAHNGDPCAATRRAIVRAAAALGRSA